MKIQIVSDLHLDATKQPVRRLPEYLTPSAPYLALLGDICTLNNNVLKQFLLKVCGMYEKVFYLYGNHEWYDTKPNRVVTQSANKFRKWVVENTNNLVVLDNETYDLEGYRIIGGTMWGKIDAQHDYACSQRMNDYRFTYTRFGKLTVQMTNQMHVEFCGFLTKELARARAEKKPVIVFTHHAPMFDDRMQADKYRGDPCSQAFMIDMTGYMSNNVKLWAFGHTHHTVDFTDLYTRIYSNPKGGDGDPQNKHYMKDAIVELPDQDGTNDLHVGERKVS
jgi:predicted MPP superfamily phosphohydrolase